MFLFPVPSDWFQPDQKENDRKIIGKDRTGQ